MAAKKTQRRRNPRRTRKAHGEAGRFGLLNKDKDKFYVWANMNDANCGAPKYAADGYSVETYAPGGVMPSIGRTDQAEEITNSGHVLMSIPKAERESIEEWGEEGQTGQDLADRLEERMFERRRGSSLDHFRGKRRRVGDGLTVDNFDGRESLA
jgi:hypothetical protein